jgi:hypothetical protein
VQPQQIVVDGKVWQQGEPLPVGTLEVWLHFIALSSCEATIEVKEGTSAIPVAVSPQALARYIFTSNKDGVELENVLYPYTFWQSQHKKVEDHLVSMANDNNEYQFAVYLPADISEMRVYTGYRYVEKTVSLNTLRQEIGYPNRIDGVHLTRHIEALLKNIGKPETITALAKLLRRHMSNLKQMDASDKDALLQYVTKCELDTPAVLALLDQMVHE